MAKDDFKFKRGEPVVDVITGFRGYIISRTDYITSCNRYCVQPILDEKSPAILPRSEFFDETTLILDRSRTKIILEHATRSDPPG